MSEQVLCSECGEIAEYCRACESCGHCDSLHHYDGVYCKWQSPAGIACSCLVERDRVIAEGQERWPEADEDEPTVAALLGEWTASTVSWRRVNDPWDAPDA